MNTRTGHHSTRSRSSASRRFPRRPLIDVRRAEAFDARLARDSRARSGAPPEDSGRLGTRASTPGARSSCIACTVTKSGAMPRTRLRERGFDARAIWTAVSKRGAPTAARSCRMRAPTRGSRASGRRSTASRARGSCGGSSILPPSSSTCPRAEVRAFADVARRDAVRRPRRRSTAHDGERCSFDAFIRIHALADARARSPATIVRGADTGALDARRRRRPACSPCRTGLSAMLRRRSRDAARGHDDVRRALRVVPGARAGGARSSASVNARPTHRPTDAREAFRYWLRLGFISFGGPAGQIAIMHRELVDERRWISESRFLHALNYCMVLPGPEAQQLATYIGWLMHRTWGGIVAGALFVLPSLAILIALSWLYMAYGHVPAVAGVLYGVKPAVVAIVLHAAWRIGSRTLSHPALWLIAALAFVAIFVLVVPFPLIVLAAGVVGALGGRLCACRIPARRAHAAAQAKRTRLRSSTTTRRRPRMHASAPRRLAIVVDRLSRDLGPRRSARSIPLLRLGRRRSRRWAGSSPRPRCSRSAARTPCCRTCTRARWRTTQWLTPAQMIDGLALGETHARTADHGRGVRRLRRQRGRSRRSASALAAGGNRGRDGRDVLHVPAVVPVHSRGRSARRDHARPHRASPRR